MKEDISKLVDDEFDFIKSHLSKGTTLELVLLKGHLLIERAMNDLILFKMIRPRKLESRIENFNFSNKIILLESLYDFEDQNYVFNLMRDLNKLRNQYAHNLEPKKANELIDNIRLVLMTNEAEFKDALGNDMNCIELSVGFVLGVLTHTKLHNPIR